MSHGVRYGVLAGIICAAYYFLLQLAGLITNGVMQALLLIILIAAIVLAHISYKKANDGLMGYGKGLLLGVVVSLVSAVISRGYLYIHMRFIDSELLDHTMDQQAIAMEQAGYEAELIEEALASPLFTIEGATIAGLAASFVIGVILSLIIAAITRKTA
jgi:hypothetical protein